MHHNKKDSLATPPTSVSPAPYRHIQALRALIEEKGEREALKLIPISRNACMRTLASLPVRAGTRALLRETFDRVA